MSAFDLPLDQLRAYRPERDEPADFDAFWASTLADARAAPAPPSFERIDGPYRTVIVDDVTFSGFGGQPIRGWFIAPAGVTAKLPTVVEYVGYGGGRSLPLHHLGWATAGYANLVMDTRGQGSCLEPGDTPDLVGSLAAESPAADGGIPTGGAGGPGGAGALTGEYPGFVTRGITSPTTYYYRRLITDAALAVDAARAHPLADPSRIVVAGASQGGGLALAVAGLAGDAVRAALIDVPFMTHWRRAIEVTDAHPYQELVRYLRTRRSAAEAAFRTLGYHDGVHFAARATAPALFSVGLMDDICPPSTVFAAYNHYAGPKDIRVYPWNGHDAGALDHELEKFVYLDRLGIVP